MVYDMLVLVVGVLAVGKRRAATRQKPEASAVGNRPNQSYKVNMPKYKVNKKNILISS